uniref:Retrotransposon gag domain-containing protein n=1 Tax=Romanomermis culicivorax TaxID=13658 RepID=A0A915HX56_ROMCU
MAQPNPLANLQEMQELLRQTVNRVGEMYDTRPIIHHSGDLTPFSGDPSDINWMDWEKRFSRISVLAGATTLNQKTALLSTYLRGPALIYLADVEARNPPLHTWDEWWNAFLNRFPDNRQIDVKYEQLVARSQLPSKSVSAFAADVRKLGKRAY